MRRLVGARPPIRRRYGDSAGGKEVAQELARAVTSRIGIDAGTLRLARQLEPLTAVLISINKAYKVRSGIRISGI